MLWKEKKNSMRGLGSCGEESEENFNQVIIGIIEMHIAKRPVWQKQGDQGEQKQMRSER